MGNSLFDNLDCGQQSRYSAPIKNQLYFWGFREDSSRASGYVAADMLEFDDYEMVSAKREAFCYWINYRREAGW